MKRTLVVIGVVLLIVLGAVTVFSKYLGEHGKLVYEVDESSLIDFTITESGYVILKSHITVSNYTGSKQQFTMQADFNKDVGLVKERYAYVYRGDTDVPEVFYIAAGSTVTYEVEFRALHGEINTKTDRLPPDNVLLEIQ